jgi:hypothetical protein
MSISIRSVTVLTVLLLIPAALCAQRPRTVTQESSELSSNAPAPGPAPAKVKAKYEGGVFGQPNKMEGTLSLDDPNQRLVFRDKKNKEIVSIPYDSVTGAYADTHAVQPAAATVASHIPYGGMAGLIKTKVRYLTLQFDDPDSNVSGNTSFRLENQEILDSVLNSLAQKAGLSKRGEVFIRKKQ